MGETPLKIPKPDRAAPFSLMFNNHQTKSLAPAMGEG